MNGTTEAKEVLSYFMEGVRGGLVILTTAEELALLAVMLPMEQVGTY